MLLACLLLFGAAATACGETTGDTPQGAANDGGASGADAKIASDAVTDVVVVTDASRDSAVDAGCGAVKQGDTCSQEGATCRGSPCTDPCSFCSSLLCMGGKWQMMEAFPLPPNECADTFDCNGKTCKRGEFCVANHAGVMLADGGSAPPTYACVPLDPSCKGGCTCAMAAAQNMSSCQPTTCAAPDGGPIVQCYGI